MTFKLFTGINYGENSESFSTVFESFPSVHCLASRVWCSGCLAFINPSILISLYNHHLKLEFNLFWSLNTSGQFRGTCVLLVTWFTFSSSMFWVFVCFVLLYKSSLHIRLALCQLTQIKLSSRHCAKYALPTPHLIIVFSPGLRIGPPLKTYLINQMFQSVVLVWKIIPGEKSPCPKIIEIVS